MFASGAAAPVAVAVTRRLTLPPAAAVARRVKGVAPGDTLLRVLGAGGAQLTQVGVTAIHPEVAEVRVSTLHDVPATARRASTWRGTRC